MTPLYARLVEIERELEVLMIGLQRTAGELQAKRRELAQAAAEREASRTMNANPPKESP